MTYFPLIMRGKSDFWWENQELKCFEANNDIYHCHFNPKLAYLVEILPKIHIWAPHFGTTSQFATTMVYRTNMVLVFPPWVLVKNDTPKMSSDFPPMMRGKCEIFAPMVGGKRTQFPKSAVTPKISSRVCRRKWGNLSGQLRSVFMLEDTQTLPEKK